MSPLTAASTEAEMALMAAQITSHRVALNKVMAYARALALRALQEGNSEVAVAEALGVDPMMIRAWAGK
jgi:hypothetical protein